MTRPLWEPSPKKIKESSVTHFIANVNDKYSLRIENYWDLDAWSVAEPEKFWSLVWDFCGVIAKHKGDIVLVHGKHMQDARWFPSAQLNFAENLLRRRDDATALIFWGEDKVKRHISYRELYDAVSRMAQALSAQGVQVGDRVVGFLPNLPEAIMLMLATSSIGATWSSCSPDFGVQGVLDRFSQIEPTILISADGYYFNGKTIDCLDRLVAIEKGLPTLKKVVVVPYIRELPNLSALKNAVLLDTFVKPYRSQKITFVQLPFNHPLYILFSSGTTGVPKCIVHGAGGTLLQHIKEHVLHVGLCDGDRLFYQTTCGWMMWNWLCSGLAVGATLLLYDGFPLYRRGTILFDFADAEHMTVFGTSAKYIEALLKGGITPRTTHKLEHMNVMLSTGSPLSPEDFDFVYKHIKSSVRLSSISGGTDIVSCFVQGSPVLPVWRGEIQCRGLGLKVEIYNQQGESVQKEKGELVCTAPFPAMPIGFWNDTDGTKYHAAYFEKFADVWCHGDYAEITSHRGFILYGRSDTVLNPGGVRIGTAEIYRQVEQVNEVVESIAVSQEWGSDVRTILFVKLRDNLLLNEELASSIRKQILKNTTVYHVPAKILQVTDIPRTKSGKIVEIAVRDVVNERTIQNQEALANPEALEQFKNRPELLK